MLRPSAARTRLPRLLLALATCGAAVALALGVSARAAHAQSREALGTLEREAADEALRARGLTIDPAPDGKRVGAIHVVTLEVFSERDFFLPLFNRFHRTSREAVVEREVLLRPGQPYDRALVEETVRQFQGDVDLTSAVAILPVKAPRPGQVDLLVVTRDVWSLRLNSDFSYQQGLLEALAISLSENNLFGLRKRASLDLTMDLGALAVGPTYHDPNVRGTRVTFTARARALYERDDGKLEGGWASASLALPLYSLASRWGASLDASHSDGVVRVFQEGQLYPVPVPVEGGARLLVPWIYRQRDTSVSAAVRRQLGRRVIHQVALGHAINVTRPSFVEGVPADPRLRQAFAAEVFPFSEIISAPSLSYSLFTPWYRRYRDFETFDLTETFRLGPTLGASAAYAAPALGSDREYLYLSGSASLRLGLRGGYQSLSGSLSGYLQEGRLVDQTISYGAVVATPVLFRRVRLVATASGTRYRRTLRARYLYLGGSSGLRGYLINEFRGRALILSHLEARSMPVPVFSLRLGAVLFWDVGHAARAFEALDPHHDLGVGLRLLIPQFNTYVLRFDWAFPTRDTFDPETGQRRTRAGWPGRVSVGFRQGF